MIALPSVATLPTASTAILRLDLDLPLSDGQILDNSRLLKSLPTIQLLLDQSCHLAVIGHLGRPAGFDPHLSLLPIFQELKSLLPDVSFNFVTDFSDPKVISSSLTSFQISFFENLRFFPGEESGDFAFLSPLVSLTTAYVNDAFAVAHRAHASILLHQKLPTFYGLSFLEEVTYLNTFLDHPLRPLTLILGGAKADKLQYLDQLTAFVDHLLIGGKLPQFITTSPSSKVLVATLDSSSFDLSPSSIADFEAIVATSQSLIWAGAMGFYEDPSHRLGTQAIARALANSSGKKVVAGGDTAASIKDLGLSNRIDFVCSGGGVMLTYLALKTLPAW